MRRIYFPSLPDLWTNVRLFDISEVVMGQSPPGETYNENKVGLPFFQGKAEFGELYPTPQKWCSAPTRIAKAGDILISVRAPVGATNIAKEQCCIGRGLAAIRPINDVAERDFLLFYLRAIEEFLSTAGYGSTFQAINKNDLLNFRIPLPPLPEQEKVVSILEQADKLSRLRDETITMAQKLFQTLFLEMFGDPLSNPKCFPKIQLDRLGTLDRGISKHRPRDASFLFGGRYPFIQTGNVANSGGWINNYSQTYSEEGLAQSRLWPEGTLCITIAANIAKTGILTFDACFPDSVVGFLPNQGITTEYIMFALNLFQQRLEANAPQAAQKNINLQILRSLKIPKPPFDIQEKFSHIVKNNYKNILKIKKLSEDLVELFQQIQSEAFCGELTSMLQLRSISLKNAPGYPSQTAIG
ncbi:MAG: restriction endonuclease subunit S [Deltaproteobacteria bacterium]|nr:restriction endonuclease subunit S [Deltaproteobacteria bacterium]